MCFFFFLLSHLSLSLQTLQRTSINALKWWVSLCRHTKICPNKKQKQTTIIIKKKANKYRKKNQQESHFSSTTLKIIILTGKTRNRRKGEENLEALTKKGFEGNTEWGFAKAPPLVWRDLILEEVGEEVEGIVNERKTFYLGSLAYRWAAVVVLVLLLWVTNMGQRGD